MGKGLIAGALLAVTAACSSATSVDSDQINVQNLLGTELAFVPHDYSDAGLATNLSKLGLPLLLFDITLCRADSSATTYNAAHVPHDLTLTYGASSCGTGGTLATSYSGSIRIEDQGGGYSAKVTYNNLKRTFTLPGGGIVTTLNGTVTVRATTANLVTVEQHTTEHEIASSSVGTTEIDRVRNLTIALTDTSGHAADGVLYLPAQLTMTGTVGLTYLGPDPYDLDVAVSTPVPLVPALICSSGFRSGQLHGDATGSHTGQVTLNYSCQ
ncbi:MAG: hypothetical protein U0132_19430 [Gemmatimonadaceae bacterium]